MTQQTKHLTINLGLAMLFILVSVLIFIVWYNADAIDKAMEPSNNSMLYHEDLSTGFSEREVPYE